MADETAKKTPDQDAQGRWHELLSPTQVLTDENVEPPAEQNREVQSQPCKLCQEHAKNNVHDEGSSSMDQDTNEADSQQRTGSEEEEEQSMQVGFSCFAVRVHPSLISRHFLRLR